MSTADCIRSVILTSKEICNKYLVTPCSIETVSEVLKKKIDEVDIIFVDFDGCLAPESEPYQLEVFKAILDKYTGITHDINQVMADVTGNPIKDSYKLFRKKYGFDVAPKKATKEHFKMYNQLVKDNKIVPHPVIVAALLHAKEQGKPIYILSNANIKTVCPSVKRWTKQGLLPKNLFNAIFAYDSETRKKLPKAEFIKKFCPKNKIAAMFEDSLSTLEKMSVYGIRGFLFHSPSTPQEITSSDKLNNYTVFDTPSVPMKEGWHKEWRSSGYFNRLINSAL